MGTHSFKELKRHIGHRVAVVGYGQSEVLNVAVECEDCNEVLLDYNKGQSDYELSEIEEGENND